MIDEENQWIEPNKKTDTEVKIPVEGRVSLYAWQPEGHGEYSLFVAAKSEDEARKAVGKYIEEHLGS